MISLDVSVLGDVPLDVSEFGDVQVSCSKWVSELLLIVLATLPLLPGVGISFAIIAIIKALKLDKLGFLCLVITTCGQMKMKS